jgi:hypothetical protein
MLKVNEIPEQEKHCFATRYLKEVVIMEQHFFEIGDIPVKIANKYHGDLRR